eukprot:5314927-Alexandrium_andersonii.AAC.1
MKSLPWSQQPRWCQLMRSKATNAGEELRGMDRADVHHAWMCSTSSWGQGRDLTMASPIAVECVS